MKNYIILFFILFTLNSKISSQVLTRVLGENEKMETYLPFISKDEPIITHKQPKLDFERFLKEDKEKDRKIPRHAVSYDVNYSDKDGSWHQFEKNSIWKIGFKAEKASSLQFKLEEVNLPSDAEMYIYSTESQMIQGPITLESITNGVFVSDIIERTGSVQIALICKNDDKKKIKFKIKKIAQGITKSGERGWGTSQNCHYDVNCPIGNAWTFQRDAVGMVVVNMEGFCSGSLINNQCQDLEPNFLTAFHCVTGNTEDPSNWVFRFNWQVTNPPSSSCPGSTSGNEPHPATWITRSGATLRVGAEASDGALLLLNGGRIGLNPLEANLTLAGWTRDSVAPASTTIIHHPDGDAKKITFDYQHPIRFFWQWDLIAVDAGQTEKGSSGSPYFNQNGLIFAQHRGSTYVYEQICDRIRKYGGRFDKSWNLGLNTFLGTINPPMTLNGIRVPFINVDTDFAICTTNKQILLTNAIPGKTISWSVSNPSLFATSGGAATSGSGTTATLRAASNTSQGSAIITFTLAQSGCNTITFTKTIWVGKPLLPNTFPSGNPAIDIGVGQLSQISLLGHSNSTGAFPFSGHWAAYGAVSLASPNPSPGNTYTGIYQGTGNFSVYTNNSCGVSQTKWGAYNVAGNCNPCPRIIINNPVSGLLKCEIPSYKLPIGINNDNLEGDFQLMDNNGTMIKKEQFKTNMHITDVTQFNNGIYFVKMKFNDIQLVEKVIIIK